MTEQELKRLEDIYLIQSTIEALHVHKLIAEIRRLNADLESVRTTIAAAPTVYGGHLVLTDPSSGLEFMGPHGRPIGATHTARLVEIKKIGEE
jgi:hypothetical protein